MAPVVVIEPAAFFWILLVFTPLAYSASPECTVTDYSQLQTAVETCSDLLLDSLSIPSGETLRLPLKDGTKLTFRGNISFEYAERDGYLAIINGTNVVLEGEEGSTFLGHGEEYWGKVNGNEKPKFFAMTLHNATMRNINVLNSPRHCVQLFDSTDVELSYWVIDNSAGNGEGEYPLAKNTDGFDVRNTTNLVIRNSVVTNEDDCVALNSGSNILVENLVCKGGHGLSLSVGFSLDNFALNSLENVTITNSVLKEGENAIHIKTHADSGLGVIRNVTYKNIQFVDQTKYGINIQENYGGSTGSPPNNNIPIRDLTLENVVGAVGSAAVPIYVLCAEDGCFDWKFDNVFVYGSKSSNCTAAPNEIC